MPALVCKMCVRTDATARRYLCKKYIILCDVPFESFEMLFILLTYHIETAVVSQKLPSLQEI